MLQFAANLISCLVIFLLAQPAFSQAPDIRFEYIPDLTSSVVESIAQDSLGFIWIGTQGGLNQYNGHSIRPFRPIEADSTSLSDEFVYSVIADKKSRMVWVGTRDGVLNKYDYFKDRFYRYSARDSLSSKKSSIRTLLKDNRGTIWIGTEGGGLKKFDVATEAFTHYRKTLDSNPGISSDSVLALHQSSANPNYLWIGTTQGLNLLEISTNSFIRIEDAVLGAGALSSLAVTALDELANAPGYLWVGTIQGGLFRIEITRSVPEQFEISQEGVLPGEITVLRENKRMPGTLWVGTSDEGLYHFMPGSGIYAHYVPDLQQADRLAHENVQAVFQDHTGVLWVGTWGGGLNKEKLAPRFSAYTHDPEDPNSLTNPQVYSVLESREQPGIVWIGTGNGLNKWDRLQQTNTP